MFLFKRLDWRKDISSEKKILTVLVVKLSMHSILIPGLKSFHSVHIMKDFYVLNWQERLETMCFTIENVQQKIICVQVGTLASWKMHYNCVDTSTLLKKLGNLEGIGLEVIYWLTTSSYNVWQIISAFPRIWRSPSSYLICAPDFFYIRKTFPNFWSVQIGQGWF